MDVRQLINQLAAREETLRGEQFLAPCVGGGQVRVSLDGLVQTFHTRPHDFEGWGIFQPSDDAMAELVEVATLPQVAVYLKLLKPVRVRLVERLRGRTWLAYPACGEDARGRFGSADDELRVHLVSEGARFEQVVAYTDGCDLFYGEPDRRADARIAERLRKLLREGVEPRHITWKGITPEMRAVYALATEFAPEFGQVRKRRKSARRKRLEEKRLRHALGVNGGQLVDYEDEGENWRVVWRVPGGASLVSIVAKRDLTIVNAGICLSGYDRDFDLLSLVGVVKNSWDYY
ncbi:MAG TPA: hypothetical protein VGO96_16610 [Pyrinomonadaceae bacterium]|nr:hypothetical protein [Pyrinomonadaceae bacterium]